MPTKNKREFQQPTRTILHTYITSIDVKKYANKIENIFVLLIILVKNSKEIDNFMDHTVLPILRMAFTLRSCHSVFPDHINVFLKYTYTHTYHTRISG